MLDVGTQRLDLHCKAIFVTKSCDRLFLCVSLPPSQTTPPPPLLPADFFFFSPPDPGKDSVRSMGLVCWEFGNQDAEPSHGAPLQDPGDW